MITTPITDDARLRSLPKPLQKLHRADPARFPLHGPAEVTPASTLGTSLWAYAHFLKLRRSEHTIDAYCEDILLLRSAIGDKLVSRVSYQDLVNFVIALKDSGHADKSVYRRTNAVKNYFKWLVDIGVNQTNPAANLKLDRPDPVIPIIPTMAECDALVAAATDVRDYCLIVILLDAGPKRSELMEMDIDDVDTSMRYQPKVGLSLLDKHRARWVNVRREFTPRYEEYRDIRLAQIAQWKKSDDQRLFVDKSPERQKEERKARSLFCLSERYLNDSLAQLARAANVHAPISCQVLRDTCAALRIRHGQPVDEVLKDLGFLPGAINEEAREKFKTLAGKL